MKLLLLEFDREAKLVHPDQFTEIKNQLQSGKYSNLIVISHGWNNNDEEAKTLYDKLLELVSQQLAINKPYPGEFIALGIIWPSKQFGDPEPSANAASVNGFKVDNLVKQVQELSSVSVNESLKNNLAILAKQIETQSSVSILSETFADIFAILAENPTLSQQNEEDLPVFLPAKIKNMLSDPEIWNFASPQAGSGGAARINPGGAASIFAGVAESVKNLLNLTTYYMMKSRSGIIGSIGLNPLLAEIIRDFPKLGIHLIGHSFGARLISSAVLGVDEKTWIYVDSLALLQAAFSHYAFAKEYDRSLDGLYRAIVEKKLVKGTFLITHSRLDKAVGLAYALASRVADQVGARLGGKDDYYGGLGGNGAQKTPESVQIELLDKDGAYSFETGKVYNLKSDRFISGHSDICNEQVAHALAESFSSINFKVFTTNPIPNKP